VVVGAIPELVEKYINFWSRKLALVVGMKKQKAE